VRETSGGSILDGYRFKRYEDILKILPVARDVLDRSGADGTWDQRQVLDATPPPSYNVRDQPRPVFAGSHVQYDAVRIFGNDTLAEKLDFEDEAVEVIPKEEIGSASKKQETSGRTSLADEALQFFNGSDVGEVPSTNVESKRVVVEERDIFPDPRAKASLSGRPARSCGGEFRNTYSLLREFPGQPRQPSAQASR
jgi:hypothetical protein